MELGGKDVVIVGLGKSGVSAARLCLARGARVIATDRTPLRELSPEVSSLGVELVPGGHDAVSFETAALVVVSPGVPPMPVLDAVSARGVEVIGELELASRFVTAPIVAVGGTNGKSTTTTAIAAIFEAAGFGVFSGGNLGTPLSEAVGGSYDVLVVEVSSFQLERAPTFHPRVSVLLNVTDDHLDRYADLVAYAHAKGNAFVNQTERDVAIVPAGDEVCVLEARRGKGRIVTFGRNADYSTGDHSVEERATGVRFSLEGTEFYGRHNVDNAAAAIAAARALGADAESVAAGLRRFRALPHRMAFVGEIDGVRFYDDSKATNVGAAVTALGGIEEPKAVLIAGGRDKFGSYAPLVAALRERGRAVVVVGEAADRIAEAVGDQVPIARAGTMDIAVREARRLARPGDAVLLSPACSSFDWFSSYAERGRAFRAAVERLAQGGAS